MREYKERLLDIIEAIEKIEIYFSKGHSVFEESELIQIWFVHYLQIIGEAVSKLDKSFQGKYPEIPWAQIIASRNILVHEYFGIDKDEIWKTIENDIPVIKRKIIDILNQLDNNIGSK